MKKVLYTCDHCGKEIDDVSFTGLHINDFIDFVDTDLCNKCFHELNDIVVQFVNQKKGN